MKTRSLLPWTICLLIAGQAYGQITLTEADVRARLGAQITTTSYGATALTGLQAVAGETGDNKTFDLRSAAFGSGETYTAELIACASDIPGCNDTDFSTANFISREVHAHGNTDSTAVSFARLASDGFYVLGGASRGDFDPSVPGLEEIIFKYKPALLVQKLPLTMGTAWTANTAFETSGFGSDEALVFTYDEDNVVDGWGTLVTPAGSASALKLKTKTTTTFSIAGVTITNTFYRIAFITNANLNATMVLDEQGNVTGASYIVVGSVNTATEPSVELPARIALAQNFPNPFNPGTTIPFTLRDGGPVRLTVYDLLGREVAVLVDDVRPAGAYQVTWAAGDLPSGAYLYKLSADGASVTRLLTLLK